MSALTPRERLRNLGARLLGDQDLRERQVEGTRDLQGSFVARDHMHGPTDRLDEAGEARLTGVPGGVRLTCAMLAGHDLGWTLVSLRDHRRR